MKIGFVVNDVGGELPQYTTTRLALAATQMGHEAWLMGVGDFAYEPDGSLSASARGPVDGEEVQVDSSGSSPTCRATTASSEQLPLGELDVVMLRNDPADDVVERPWAPTAGGGLRPADLGERRARRQRPRAPRRRPQQGLLPALPRARPAPHARSPATQQLITEFVDDLGGRAVLKPLQGSGGSGVFLVSEKESPNLNQIIEAIARDGYVVAQEYLPAAAEGDVRLFVMNGEPLVHDGRHRRVPPRERRAPTCART